MSENKRNGYWDLLCLLEDYMSGGFEQEHGKPPGKIVLKAPGKSREEQFQELKATVMTCTRCGLHRDRNSAVPGEGVMNPLVFVIGEGPGADEDRTGRPFVGRAGQYLDKWLDAVDLSRDTNCYIGNIIKCRPPGNRDPLPEESSACLPYLERQIGLLKPKVILSLGRIASRILTGSEKGITALRGKTYSYLGIPLVPTYHPSGVLRNPEYRAPVWEDLKLLKSLLS